MPDHLQSSLTPFTEDLIEKVVPRVVDELARRRLLIAEYLTNKEAALYLSCSQSFLTRARQQGIGPAWIKFGKEGIRYSRFDLDKWMLANTQRGGEPS